ncbi:cytochrome P450 [Myxococcus sp. K38C18041901]|uniref:cytochrome P450 n=1 Tax=Myxococcus guangdongensis TaxID=2906760 RepID=UPI0020A7206D|nr:cytochrome P450 [Myxococcus guangdongensis]MCP3061698.1 cytochrome P450 [Myxococcus guangdongensis]
MSTRLNFLSREFIEDPHPHLAELRRQGPLVQADPGGMWVVTRYDEAQYVFRSSQLFSSSQLRLAFEPEWLGKTNPFATSLPFMDPPQHGRMRALLSQAFTPKALAPLEARIRVLARECVSRMMREREVEFMDAFAALIPSSVMGWLLGLDASLRGQLKRWTYDIMTIGGVLPGDTAQMEQSRHTIDELTRYFQEVLEDRRRSPGEDMVSDLLRARVDGEALTDEELTSVFFALLAGGLDTTTHLLGQSARILALHPELLSRLREDSALVPRFVEEALRYEPVGMLTLRVCLDDVTLAGVFLPKGTTVAVSMASAARDEKHFPEGDRFILERKGSPHLSFGHGLHYCLGAVLTRMETRVALEELVSRVSRVKLRTERIDWTQALITRGPRTLPVELFPA